MDLSSSIDRVEAAVQDPPELERIRAEALRDSGLEDGDKQFVSERVGMYLADHDRERLAHGSTDYDLDDVADEGEEA
jgi:hypothetical protein